MADTYTYDNTLSTDKDKVRFYLGDTDVTNTELRKVTNEEILAILAIYPNPIKTAIVIAESLSARYSAYSDESVGDISVSYGQVAKNYQDLAARLGMRLTTESGGIVAGGLSQSAKDALAENSDAVSPAFTKELHNNPQTGLSDEDNHQN
jgi:hypothetical protein